MSESPIQSLERGLKILEILGESPAPLTLTEIAEKTQLTKTTVNRFLKTLHTLGYLLRENKKYSVGPKILSLGFKFLNSSDLVKLVKPFLDDLAARFNTTVNLSVLDGHETIIMYRNEVSRFMKFDLHPGTRLPAYCSALGKMLLAGLDDKELEENIGDTDLQRVTPKTITSKEKLLKGLRMARRIGYAVSDQEISMDLFSIAVPILNEMGKTVGAINISMNIRDRNKSVTNKAVQELIKKGELISHILGYRGHYPAAPK